MKKLMMSMVSAILFSAAALAQQAGPALNAAVAKLEKAAAPKDFEALEKEFVALTKTQPADWQPWYYAAFCNAKIGFLYQEDGEKIEPYSIRGEEQINKAQSLLDSTKQRAELSEVFTVTSMVYRTKVFINPMTYGRKYGTMSEKYLQQAKSLNPQNPRALYVQAWVKYYTPKMWGGDKKQAKELAEQSLALLAKEQPGALPHWGKREDQELLSKYK